MNGVILAHAYTIPAVRHSGVIDYATENLRPTRHVIRVHLVSSNGVGWDFERTDLELAISWNSATSLFDEPYERDES